MGASKGCSGQQQQAAEGYDSHLATGSKWKADAKTAESCVKQSKAEAMSATHFATYLILPSVDASLQNLLPQLCSTLWCKQAYGSTEHAKTTS